MSQYTIKRAAGTVSLTGDVAGMAWAAADVLEIDDFPWYKGGAKQGTEVRLMYDDKNIYVQFLCADRHIYSEETRHNGNVYKDSCVEFFATIDPEAGPDYFNLEINCCGVMHVGYGPERNGRILMVEELARRMTLVTSVPGPTRQESPSDNGWWVAAKIPFDVIGEFAGKKVAPKSGALWKANFYRCGGKTDGQFGCWNHIAWPKPDFHRPEFFGELKFA